MPSLSILFTLIIEILLNKIQEDKHLEGIKIRHFHYKYRAFADNVVFFMEDPKTNLPKLIETIERFGKWAGFYINKNKSKLLLKNINNEEQNLIGILSQCEVVQKVKYLGVDITNKNISLFKNNYEKAWKKIKEDLIKWNHQNLSLLGRVAVIKMNILPSILYFFQTIPIINKQQHFKKWKKDITNFIWGSRKPRMKYKILCDTREHGGMQLPDVERYYDACRLVWVRDWITLENKLLVLEGAL